MNREIHKKIRYLSPNGVLHHLGPTQFLPSCQCAIVSLCSVMSLKFYYNVRFSKSKKITIIKHTLPVLFKLVSLSLLALDILCDMLLLCDVSLLSFVDKLSCDISINFLLIYMYGQSRLAWSSPLASVPSYRGLVLLTSGLNPGHGPLTLPVDRHEEGDLSNMVLSHRWSKTTIMEEMTTMRRRAKLSYELCCREMVKLSLICRIKWVPESEGIPESFFIHGTEAILIEIQAKCSI